jgi:hypothetical protein
MLILAMLIFNYVPKERNRFWIYFDKIIWIFGLTIVTINLVLYCISISFDDTSLNNFPLSKLYFIIAFLYYIILSLDLGYILFKSPTNLFSIQ